MIAGKVALVTGGSRGIGAAICRELAATQAVVGVGYVRDASAAEGVCARIRSAGGRALPVPADVSQPGEVEALVERVHQALGPVQVLVNNAGVAEVHRLADASPRTWRRMVEVNLDGAFYCTQAAMRTMREAGWGRIVNVSSGAIYQGGIVGPAYAAAKAGLVALTRWTARELAPFHIAANAVVPALVESDMLGELLADGAARERALQSIPLGRFGRPEEVATVVRFLCAEAPEYLTGAVIDLAGGR